MRVFVVLSVGSLLGRNRLVFGRLVEQQLLRDRKRNLWVWSCWLLVQSLCPLLGPPPLLCRRCRCRLRGLLLRRWLWPLKVLVLEARENLLGISRFRIYQLRKWFPPIFQFLALRNQIVLVLNYLVYFGLDHVIWPLLFQSDAGRIRVLLLFEVDEPLEVQKVLDHVILVEVVLQLDQVLINFVQDVLVLGLPGVLVDLRLLVHSLLLRDIAEEVLDVFIFKHPLVEQVLPDAVELELAGLNLPVGGLQLEEPELFDVLKAALELVVVSKNDVEYLLVLTLSVDESLEPLAGLLDVFPGSPASFLSDLLVAHRIVQVHFLLLVREVQMALRYL